ncbi:MAG: MATE family efflux transporter [Aeropyrum sp.]|nr:MATE family efflux transporter [Aeropyrum sp.]
MPLVDARIARKALEIAWPLMVADSSLSIAWIVDTYFVGGLGYESIAAVGAAGYLVWLFMVFSTLVYMGMLVLLGQATGAGEKGILEKVSGEGLTLSALLGAAVIVLGIPASKWALAFLARDVYDIAWDYMWVSLIGVGIHYIALAYDSVFRALGRTKPILYSSLLFSLLNAVLDPILIYGYFGLPALGVSGAAWAVVIASIASTVSLAYFSRNLEVRVRPLLPGRTSVEILKLGFPSMVERVVFVLGNVVYLGSISRCGEEALAAHTIGVRVESIAFLPMFSMATAAGVMVGWDVGSGRIEESKKVGWELIKASVIIGLVIGLALAAGGWFIGGFFTDSVEVAWLAGVYLLIAGLTEPLLGAVMTVAQIIRNAGDTRTPTILNLSSLYILRVIPAYLLPGLMPEGLCALGAWLAMAVDIVGRGLIFSVIYAAYYQKLARKIV